MLRQSLLVLLLALTFAPAADLSAQEPAPGDSIVGLDLPDEVAEQVIAAFNDPERLRLMGSATLASGDTIRADLAVLEGPLVLGGHIAGDLLVVNGDLRLLPGASVDGDLQVVGGAVEGVEGARIQGEISVYPDRLRYRREGGQIVRVGASRAPGTFSQALQWGRSDFLIATGDSYNRVEGLPITFGPRIRTAGSNPLRLHALAIYRTETGVRIDTDDLGYYVRAEQFVGGHRALRVGATAHSLIDPIEEWQITDLESGISTFLFHRDFRDHFERTGVSFFGTWEAARSPLSATVELRRDRHRTTAAGSPWSLFRNAEPWRPEPLVGEGRVTSARLSGAFDTRSDPEDPATGWYLQGRLEQALASDLALPTSFLPDAGEMGPQQTLASGTEFGRFTTGLLDIRRYNRVDPRSRLNFRLLAGGSLDGDPLPPQYQHALGGEGSLPGYDLFGLDCQARSTTVFRSAAEASAPLATPYFPRYGCDAFGLFQAEYRGRFSFRFNWDSAPWLDESEEDELVLEGERTWEFAPDWTVFVDAARGWSMASATDEDLSVDVGVGLVLGRLGAFIALPLSGEGGINAFVRLGPRF